MLMLEHENGEPLMDKSLTQFPLKLAENDDVGETVI